MMIITIINMLIIITIIIKMHYLFVEEWSHRGGLTL
jgi:hypothetical protein